MVSDSIRKLYTARGIGGFFSGWLLVTVASVVICYPAYVIHDATTQPYRDQLRSEIGDIHSEQMSLTIGRITTPWTKEGDRRFEELSDSNLALSKKLRVAEDSLGLWWFIFGLSILQYPAIRAYRRVFTAE